MFVWKRLHPDLIFPTDISTNNRIELVVTFFIALKMLFHCLLVSIVYGEKSISRHHYSMTAEVPFYFLFPQQSLN